MVRCVSLIVMLVISTAASAQGNKFRPATTPDDERACRGDAHRFCKDEIPDQLKVLACLQEHRAKLTKTCADLLQKNGV
jgi:Cysteine rich repeat